jgi:hypothetical protein
MWFFLLMTVLPGAPRKKYIVNRDMIVFGGQKPNKEPVNQPISTYAVEFLLEKKSCPAKSVITSVTTGEIACI